MVRHYFLFAANSGLRSSEIRKLQWHNVTTYKDRTSRGEEGIFANVLVDRSTSKVEVLPLFIGWHGFKFNRNINRLRYGSYFHFLKGTIRCKLGAKPSIE